MNKDSEFQNFKDFISFLRTKKKIYLDASTERTILTTYRMCPQDALLMVMAISQEGRALRASLQGGEE